MAFELSEWNLRHMALIPAHIRIALSPLRTAELYARLGAWWYAGMEPDMVELVRSLTGGLSDFWTTKHERDSLDQ
jgi:hypothetical protein